MNVTWANGKPSGPSSLDGEGAFHVMAESSINPVWIYDAESLQFLWVNDATVAAYGYSREELLGMRVTHIRPPEDVGPFLAHLGDVEDDPERSRTWRHLAKDGTIHDVEVMGGPVPFAGRRARFAIVRHVTPLLEARHLAEERAQRLEALHAIDLGIIAAASIQEIARAALEHVRDLVPCDGLGLTLIEPGGETARTFLWHAGAPRRLAVQEPLSLSPYRDILSVLRSEGTYVVGDLAGPAELPPILARLRDDGRASVAALALREGEELLGFLALYSNQPGAFGPREQKVAAEVAAQLAIAITQTRLREHERELAADRLRLLSDLVNAQEEERKRISADLHDDVIQKMAALAMRLELAVSRHPELAEDPYLAKLRGATDETIRSLRTATFRLRPPALGDEGLGETLRTYLAEEIGERPVSFVVEDHLQSRLGDAVRTALFRIAQEAIVNALKHAGPTSIAVLLREAPGGALLRVTDDGDGWDAGPRPESPRGHLGLTAMRERAESLGGWLRIDSRRGQGTVVECLALTAS